jgi:hypothetical protein
MVLRTVMAFAVSSFLVFGRKLYSTARAVFRRRQINGPAFCAVTGMLAEAAFLIAKHLGFVNISDKLPSNETGDVAECIFRKGCRSIA